MWEWIKNVFGGGKLVKDVMVGLDDLFTSDEERSKAKIKLTKILKEKELEAERLYLSDRDSARKREVNAKSNMMMNVVGFGVVIGWFFSIFWVLTQKIEPEQATIVTHAMGIVEGGFLAMIGYYYGASLRKKQ